MGELVSAGLFSGAGGLDLGFEQAGYRHAVALDTLPVAVETLRANRPSWNVRCDDVRGFDDLSRDAADVLLAGFPCQGFSLGGRRSADDDRNGLYREVVRIARRSRPRVVVMENVLNLRTMRVPGSQEPFSEQIARELTSAGYNVAWRIFRMADHGVPQTRRRFVFVGFRDDLDVKFRWPEADGIATVRAALHDLAHADETPDLANHDPCWGFESRVHRSRGGPFDAAAPVVPVRFSRTASDGRPVRSFDKPFPAVDTATLWGFAQGGVTAERVVKNRRCEPFVRDPSSAVTLWRLNADCFRRMTAREMARLQTFPDDWVFRGRARRDVQLQIGNAVPVEFARRLGVSVAEALGAPVQDAPPLQGQQALAL